jgi:hypothetical protein
MMGFESMQMHMIRKMLQSITNGNMKKHGRSILLTGVA